MANILVTGGLGFIGSHLADELINEGHDVTIIDSEKHPSYKPDCKMIQGDIRDEKEVEAAAKGKDKIFHLAAQVSVAVSVEKPHLTAETNVLGTLNLLKSAVENEVTNFVNISSCAVYGEPDYLPMDEKHPLNPKSPYAASKLAAEDFCRMYHDLHGLNVNSLRLFNVYGPRQQGEYAGVIQIFINRLKKKKHPIIFGDGEQTRDFVYVKDVVAATLAASRKDGCEAFNIGLGQRQTVNSIAETILKYHNSDLRAEYQPPRPGDPKHTLADISKAEKLLGYSPRYSFDQGLTETLDWFSEK